MGAQQTPESGCDWGSTCGWAGLSQPIFPMLFDLSPDNITRATVVGEARFRLSKWGSKNPFVTFHVGKWCLQDWAKIYASASGKSWFSNCSVVCLSLVCLGIWWAFDWPVISAVFIYKNSEIMWGEPDYLFILLPLLLSQWASLILWIPGHILTPMHTPYQVSYWAHALKYTLFPPLSLTQLTASIWDPQFSFYLLFTKEQIRLLL